MGFEGFMVFCHFLVFRFSFCHPPQIRLGQWLPDGPAGTGPSPVPALRRGKSERSDKYGLTDDGCTVSYRDAALAGLS